MSAAVKTKQSIYLQRRAIKEYWHSGIAKAPTAALCDSQLSQTATSSKQKQSILLGEEVSNERRKMREQMAHSFKRATFGLKLLQDKDMITNNKTDVRLIEKADINSVVLGKKIVRK